MSGALYVMLLQISHRVYACHFKSLRVSDTSLWTYKYLKRKSHLKFKIIKQIFRTINNLQCVMIWPIQAVNFQWQMITCKHSSLKPLSQSRPGGVYFDGHNNWHSWPVWVLSHSAEARPSTSLIKTDGWGAFLLLTANLHTVYAAI